MEWEASDFVDDDVLASDGRPAGRRAFRHDMTWRIPLSVFAMLMLWHVLLALVDAVWTAGRRRVRGWARGRRVFTPVNGELSLESVAMGKLAIADMAVRDVAVSDSFHATIDRSAP